MPNQLHTLIRGPEDQHYVLGTEESFLLKDISQEVIATYAGSVNWDGGSTFAWGSPVVNLWLVGRPVLITPAELPAAVRSEFYTVYLSGFFLYNDAIKLYVKVNPDGTYQTKDEFDGVYSTAQPFQKNVRLPLKHGVEFLFPSDAQGDTYEWEIEVTKFGTPEFCHHAAFQEQVYITSPGQELAAISGNLVYSHMLTDYTYDDLNDLTVPRTAIQATGLSEFFEHLVVVQGNLVIWSGLRDPWMWNQVQHSESDFKLLEWERDPPTALVRVGELLYLHYPQSVYRIEYVGLPSVMRIFRATDNIGAIGNRLCLVHRNIQFFLGMDNFYLWDGTERRNPQPIGDDIWETFLQMVDLSSVRDGWSYVDLINHEAVFVFKSAAGVENGIGFVFNYEEGHWTVCSIEGLVDHMSAYLPDSFSKIADATDTIAALTSPIKELEEHIATTSGAWKPSLINIWIDSTSVLIDEDSSDILSELSPQDVPYLESDDFTFGDLHFQKSVNEMVIDADYGPGCDGIDVYGSGRSGVSKPVEYQYLGRWRKDDEFSSFTFRELYGKVMRFKFIPKVMTDGEGLGSVTIYGWGLSVNTPGQPVGPDK